MFAIVSTYRAKAGEEDAIIALHENYERRNQGLKGYLSWQLFSNIQTSREFIAIAQFESEELARASITDLKRDAWYDRLISLIEGEAIHTDYMRMWQLQ